MYTYCRLHAGTTSGTHGKFIFVAVVQIHYPHFATWVIQRTLGCGPQYDVDSEWPHLNAWHNTSASQ